MQDSKGTSSIVRSGPLSKYRADRAGNIYNSQGRVMIQKDPNRLVLWLSDEHKYVTYSRAELMGSAFLSQDLFDPNRVRVLQKDKTKGFNIENLYLEDMSLEPDEEIRRVNEHVSVTSKGRVMLHNHKTNNDKFSYAKQWATQIDSNGYLFVNIYNKPELVHRLVASMFVPNFDIDKYDVVNHLDGNPHNNAASNLEWTDDAGNNHHARVTGLMTTSNNVRVIRLDSGKIYSSITSAAADIGVNTCSLHEAITHHRPCRGILFERIDGGWRSVKCVETGQIFRSVQLAADWCHVDVATLKKHLLRGSPIQSTLGQMFTFKEISRYE